MLSKCDQAKYFLSKVESTFSDRFHKYDIFILYPIILIYIQYIQNCQFITDNK